MDITERKITKIAREAEKLVLVSLREQGVGELMTKAVSDVDDCVGGMRKFTTEVFDTGVALIGYAVMLFTYDVRLALLSLIFTPVSYICAELMKKPVQRAGANYKNAAGNLSAAALDRARNAVTYRIYGCEDVRAERYEETLKSYEKSAVRSNAWQSALPPLYLAVSGAGGCVYSLLRGKKCAWKRVDRLEYSGVYNIYFLIYKAYGKILKGCKAV